jgi:hypothetical protein
MATPARKPEYVTERLGPLARPSGTIDRDKGIVFGVRVVNCESGNGRYYPPAVLRAAASKYEGRPSYWGHRKSPTDTADPNVRFGTLRNVRPSADGKGLDADLHLNPKKRESEDFFWACENDPGFYSLSPHHLIRWHRQLDRDGRKVAESIDEVASVDVVSEGGTTSSVFEALGDQQMTPQEVAATVTDAAALDTWLKDFFDALDPATFTAEVKTAAAETLAAAVSGVDEVSEPADPAADPAAAMESLRRRGKVGKWAAGELDARFTKEAAETARTKARDLCRAAGLSDAHVSEVFLEMVTEAKSDDRAKALIAERKQLVAGKQSPRTTTGGTGKQSVKDIVAGLDAA